MPRADPELTDDALDERRALAAALVEVGRAVRDAVRDGGGDVEADRSVVRHEGGDDVFGIDARADAALRDALPDLEAWPGLLVCEGFDEPMQVGADGGSWRYLADPVDGTRGLLAGTRSAWVLLGAGDGAQTLEDLEVGVAVEIPTDRAAKGLVALAVRGDGTHAWDDVLAGGYPRRRALRPQRDGSLDRRFVTVVRLLPGSHATIGAFADEVLAGLEVWDDLSPCSGGQLMAVAGGSAAAVLDPRPRFGERLCAHPYDLAALVVAREAGVVVEALDGGPLDVPLATDRDVAWAAYANAEIADQLRPRVKDALG